MISLKVLSLSIVLLMSSMSMVYSQCLTANDSPAAMNPDTKNLLMIAKLKFALESLEKTALIEAQDNIFYSPHSIYEALSLAYFGARGTTEMNLQNALRIPKELSKVDVQRSYALDKSIKKFTATLKHSTQSYELTTANRLYISSAKQVRQCMLDLFGSELKKVDFQANPEAVRNHINEWVSNITRGHIQDLIPSDGIDGSSDLVLVNAVYFKGLWQNRFDPANSKRAIFHGSKESLVTFMVQKKTFNHLISEDLGAHVLELPYVGNDVSMFIFLPPFVKIKTATETTECPNCQPGQDGISKLIKRMTSIEEDAKFLREILNDGMMSREVEVRLPRFTIEKQLPMGPFLDAMGAGDLMKANAADLRGFVDDKEGLHLGDAVHRAKIELNEEGTTAAAATAIFSFRSSRPAEPAVFDANHPFVYIIYDKTSETILFSGIYRTPVVATETTTT